MKKCLCKVFSIPCSTLCSEKISKALVDLNDYTMVVAEENRFVLVPSRRFSMYYNSFSPKIEVSLHVKDTEATVNLKFSPTKSSSVFMVLMCAVLIIFEFVSLLTVNSLGGSSVMLLVVPGCFGGFALFFYVGFIIASKTMCRRIVSLLNRT